MNTEKKVLEHRCNNCLIKVLFEKAKGKLVFQVCGKMCSDMCYNELRFMLKEGETTVH